MKRFISILLAVLLCCSFVSANSESASSQLTEKYAEAELLFVEGKYAEAAAIFDALGPYLDSSDMAMYCKAINVAETDEEYALAVSTFNSLGDFKNSKKMATYYTGRYYQAAGDAIDILTAEDNDLESAKSIYEKASEYYDSLTLFKDSLSRKNECQKQSEAIIAEQEARLMGADEATYRRAVAFEGNGEYQKAIEAYNTILEYKDSKERLTLCETAFKEAAYTEGIAKMEEGDWTGAAKILLKLKGYKDVNDLLLNNENLSAIVAAREPKIAPYKAVGEYVTFGSYTQTNSRTEKAPIEWLILDYDEANNRAFLLSRYGLDAMQYNNQRWADITWENCSLRSWLNNDFLNNAFSADEQSAILTTYVDNSQNQGYNGYNTDSGNNTQDMIFLLSYAEASEYLGVTKYDKENVKARVGLTAYASAQGADTFSWHDEKTSDGTPAGWWWLRSSGYDQRRAALVASDGTLDSHDATDTDISVRPALWLDLDSDYFD